MGSDVSGTDGTAETKTRGTERVTKRRRICRTIAMFRRDEFVAGDKGGQRALEVLRQHYQKKRKL